MRLRSCSLMTLVLLLAIAAAAGWLAREWLACQWALYRVGAAASVGAAQRELQWFEAGPHAPERLRELVAHWGTGHPQFDLMVASYLGQAECSEALREAFSREFAWRAELLSRWAHFWTWQARSPDEELASLAEYFQLLAAADAPRTLRWREMLDLQALFTLAEQPRLAHRLTPDNWAPRWRQWQALGRRALPHIVRPSAPFPAP